MSRDKGVALTLHRFGEASNSAEGTQRFHRLIAAGENFVGVALVSHIEHQTVPSGVEHPVDGDNQLHRSQAGGQVAAGAGNRVDQARPQQPAQLHSLTVAQFSQLIRYVIQIKIQNGSTSRPTEARNSKLRPQPSAQQSYTDTQ